MGTNLERKSLSISIKTHYQKTMAIGVALGLKFASDPVVRAEDHVDYKYEAYSEENGRMQIHTHSAYFEKDLDSRISLKGEFVYDSISGASPTGGPVLSGHKSVPLAEVDDIRRAGYLEPELKWGRNATSVQLSYSHEHDYISHGLALNHTIQFNDKNTVLNFGVSHNWDTIDPIFWGGAYENKNSTDFLVGLTQILSKSTMLTANITFGTSSGFLTDPYKQFRWTGYPVEETLSDEKRPGHKTRQVLYLGLTHFVERLDGGVEVSYRFSHDSFGILANTVQLNWYQHLGKYVILSPLFRFHQQTAADFYMVSHPGDPTDPLSWPGITYPQFYSADYRLSSLRTFTYGIGASFTIKKRVTLDVAYKRYEMLGLDGVTSSTAYPTANVYTGGLRLWF